MSEEQLRQEFDEIWAERGGMGIKPIWSEEYGYWKEPGAVACFEFFKAGRLRSQRSMQTPPALACVDGWHLQLEEGKIGLKVWNEHGEEFGPTFEYLGGEGEFLLRFRYSRYGDYEWTAPRYVVRSMLMHGGAKIVPLESSPTAPRDNEGGESS